MLAAAGRGCSDKAQGGCFGAVDASWAGVSALALFRFASRDTRIKPHLFGFRQVRITQRVEEVRNKGQDTFSKGGVEELRCGPRGPGGRLPFAGGLNVFALEAPGILRSGH